MGPNIVDRADSLSSLTKEAVPTMLKPDSQDQSNKIQSENTKQIKKNKDGWFQFETDLKWLNITVISLLHVLGVYSLFVTVLTWQWRLFLWNYIILVCAAFGVTAGVHRHWTHRSYKANIPLKIILAFMYLTAGQNPIYDWVRDHRIHHKYSETIADPHNANRGLFFSHVGWLFMKKHPEVIEKGKQIDLSDIYNDPVAAFTDRYFLPLRLLVCNVMPVVVPVLLWNEDWYYAFLAMACRYTITLNGTWSVNSFAHFYGNKPYDKVIAPAENETVARVSFGEGWHNYHHTFPYDYRAAEIGGNRTSFTTMFIDLFAKIGWAYDLKQPSRELIEATCKNRGDGSPREDTKVTNKAL